MGFAMLNPSYIKLPLNHLNAQAKGRLWTPPFAGVTRLGDRIGSDRAPD